jgi:predicted nucleic acid-binding protein
MAKLVVVDTQALIWGVKEDSTAGQEAMIARAKAFLRNEEGLDLAIPTVVLGELLVRVPSELHPMVTNLVSGGYALLGYDARAASEFARLFKKRLDDGTIEELRDGDAGETRRKTKADLMVVATAIAHGADYIVSNDAGLQTLAEGEILVQDLPTGSEQIELMEEADI